MPKKVSSVCENYKNYLIFSQKKLFNMIPWTRRKQFLQPCRKVFARGPKVFRSLVKTVRTPTIFSKKVIFFQGFWWTCGFLFWQSCWNSFNKKLKKFAQKTKVIEKVYIFTKKYLHKNFPRDTLNTVFTTEQFLLVVQNGQGKISSFKKFSWKFIYLQLNCTFLDHAEKRLPEGPIAPQSKSAEE